MQIFVDDSSELSNSTVHNKALVAAAVQFISTFLATDGTFFNEQMQVQPLQQPRRRR